MSDNLLQAVLQRIEAIEHRLASLQNPPSSNNILINSCHSAPPDLKVNKSVMTQTDPSCDEGNKSNDNISDHAETVNDISDHVETVHNGSQASPLPSL